MYREELQEQIAWRPRQVTAPITYGTLQEMGGERSAREVAEYSSMTVDEAAKALAHLANQKNIPVIRTARGRYTISNGA